MKKTEKETDERIAFLVTNLSFLALRLGKGKRALPPPPPFLATPIQLVQYNALDLNTNKVQWNDENLKMAQRQDCKLKTQFMSLALNELWKQPRTHWQLLQKNKQVCLTCLCKLYNIPKPVRQKGQVGANKDTDPVI